MEKIINVAVIGCGGIANAAHLPAYNANPHCKIKYTCDIIEERAKGAKEQYNADKYFLDYKELLKCSDFDAVSICVPNGMHDIIAIDCMKAGKDVLSEKPIANNAERALNMQKVAHETGRILDIGVCKRHSDGVNEIKKLIDNGALGEVYHIYCSFRSHRNIPGLGGAFTSKEKSGGGVLIDWGVHFLDLIIYSTGIKKIETVSANSYNNLGRVPKDYKFLDMWGMSDIENGTMTVEEMVTGLVRTDKASISFNGAWAQNINEEEMYVDFLGDKAGVRLDYASGNYKLYNIQNGVMYTCTPKKKECNAYFSEVNEFIDNVIAGGTRKNRNNIDNVIITASLMDAIYQSCELKKEIEIK